ncbi:nitrogen fixation protein NifX [Thermoleptolyngbya sichuanensis A183]|uniref:Nitrogen fixation protein NifX n=1 Tax=Thermoleptolyngbya sichuanensis A183 TaxID=2737172 RepID=A0A6M8BK51_9CYAN|nr:MULTISPECIES: nitrogen fixation protein NifX [Thermoleptolyngbya]MDG2617786.1 nitrogen fixation protein NifX [Thermoleptolyngbya sichuanensis XZ-Cy5]QKD82755.1 nitrogen fixation protein NifX [Thermoleptolyngbya sichuanensis A183]
MKVAFATQDNIHINAHFGWASKIDVYDLTPDGFTFLETLTFGGTLKEDGNEDKLEPKLKALEGCTIVYVADIGGSAAARLINRRITPMKSDSENDKITAILAQLMQTLQGSPPPWLRKVLRQEQATHFENAYTETEEEILL